MIRFIDIDTGNAYDGVAPYVHWFDNGQSVGLNYVRKICFVAPVEHATLEMDNDVFSLIDASKAAHTETINYKEFYDLTELTEDNGHKITSLTLDGAPVNGMFLFIAYILARGKYVGEFRGGLKITTDEEHDVLVAADFYDEQESLGVSLANFGQEMTAEIQRAIYEMDIQEMKPDYILLNRKYKELLNELANIVVSKGSYKSLLNSLNWFEYGKLLKMDEYWRHDNGRQMLYEHDMSQMADEVVMKMLPTFQKTAYIGISCALEHIKTGDGGIIYEDYITPVSSPSLLAEDNPALEETAFIWSKEEMSLKMALLGNFFTSCFMPIHLDLIHAAIDSITYSVTCKTLTWPKMERFDDVFSSLRIDAFIDTQPDGCLPLKYVNTHTYASTLFGAGDDDLTYGETVGVELIERPVETDKDGWVYAAKQFNGNAAIAPVHVALHDVDGCITTGKLTLVHDGTTKTITDSVNIPHVPVHGKVEMSFNVLLPDAGVWEMQLEFRRDDGAVYVAALSVTVRSMESASVTVLKLTPLSNIMRHRFDIKKWIEDNDEGSTDWSNVPRYMFSACTPPTVNPEEHFMYRQFIATSKDAMANVHTNHLIVIKMGSLTEYHMTFGYSYSNPGEVVSTHSITFTDAETMVDAIIGEIPFEANYRWFIMSSRRADVGEMTDEEREDYTGKFSGEASTYVIGVNTDFTTYNSPHIHDMRCEGLSIHSSEHFMPFFYECTPVDDCSLSAVVAYYGKRVEDITTDDIERYKTREETYRLTLGDVVCFVPSIDGVQSAGLCTWDFYCSTTERHITPEYAGYSGNETPVVLEPLLGRYDFMLLPDSGYYDLTLKFRATVSSEDTEYEAVSSFIYDGGEKKRTYTPQIPETETIEISSNGTYYTSDGKIIKVNVNAGGVWVALDDLFVNVPGQDGYMLIERKQ